MSDAESCPYSTYETSHAETTASKRIVTEKMSAAAKRRVDSTCSNPELSGKRCLIENTDETNAVEYAHCLSRSTQGGLLDSLEFAWNMPRFTLNVDTRENVIRLSSKFHELYESNCWLLLPETSIIDVYHNSRHKSHFPNISQPIYRYTFVPHPNMRPVPIHRQNSLPTEPDTPPVDFTLHSYPYRNFPTIVSHAHPRFVICNTGAKLTGNLDDWCNQGVRPQDMIKVHDIWHTWRKVVDPAQPDEQLFLRAEPDNHDPDLSVNDSPHIDGHSMLRSEMKRKSPDEQPSPTLKGTKQQKIMDNGVQARPGSSFPGPDIQNPPHAAPTH